MSTNPGGRFGTGGRQISLSPKEKEDDIQI
jgi:hypothetical protein